jgi:hypothetical protein
MIFSLPARVLARRCRRLIETDARPSLAHVLYLSESLFTALIWTRHPCLICRLLSVCHYCAAQLRNREATIKSTEGGLDGNKTTLLAIVF